jgi:hypothetical protein
VLDNLDNNVKGHLAVLSSENMPDFTPQTIYNKLRYFEKEWGSIDLVIVDHFSIMDDPIPGKSLYGPELYKYYVRFMTKLCISFSERGFVLLGLGQATQDSIEKLNEGKKLSITSIANTSEMARSATLVLGSNMSKELKELGKVQIGIVKNRLGPDGLEYEIPIKPQYQVLGDLNVERLDKEHLEKIAKGEADILYPKNLIHGISFTQFEKRLIQK